MINAISKVRSQFIIYRSPLQVPAPDTEIRFRVLGTGFANKRDNIGGLIVARPIFAFIVDEGRYCIRRVWSSAKPASGEVMLRCLRYPKTSSCNASCPFSYWLWIWFQVAGQIP